ncbi:L,D-transpeptidase family protein [Streptomyces ferrugineus]|uniref:L,D-transpeptidase family protein n=1 Tax=Streptomyces ferrugineus TaxID=1413221 RepID=A0A7M2SI91_9ACTN|nr:L,D-transpeptidase family protein [Streptomyces ferrugineus]QOV36060.1 L,D-transpeptidase family protein [Streptomyces ferrugineus]
MQVFPRQALISAAVVSVLAVTAACGGQDDQQAAAADSVEASRTPGDSPADASGSASPSASVSASPSTSDDASASASPSASASDAATREAGAAASGTGAGTGTGSATGGQQDPAPAAPAAPDFPVPVEAGDATQLITVKASGSYATVTAWAKGSSGWKAQFSTSAGRVGSNGVTDGATRRQSTYTTPSGTYTITEGFGHLAGGTAMPYHVVTDDDWWVQDPESKFYNSMHGEEGADFPLTESGDRGSEHLINYPTQYAKALVINFNRWPATPGRGAGIFLHVNGSGATAGCVSVPRATMDRIMGWITPSAHPRIAIG